MSVKARSQCWAILLYYCLSYFLRRGLSLNLVIDSLLVWLSVSSISSVRVIDIDTDIDIDNIETYTQIYLYPYICDSNTGSGLYIPIYMYVYYTFLNFFCGCWWSEFRSMLNGRHFIILPIFPAPNHYHFSLVYLWCLKSWKGHDCFGGKQREEYFRM